MTHHARCMVRTLRCWPRSQNIKAVDLADFGEVAKIVEIKHTISSTEGGLVAGRLISYRGWRPGGIGGT
jgi:hypothetical protein